MDRPAPYRCAGDIPSCGLTVLVEPQKPALDIVFVHGFTGHPERTWSRKGEGGTHREDLADGDQSLDHRSKAPRRSLFTRSPHDEKPPSRKHVYWPRDLLPYTAPDARVLTYGYDTRIRHRFGPPPSKNTVYDIAWDFLVTLEAERRSDPSRPVIFVAHSLGGIVVREMLRRSSRCHINNSHLHGVYESTIGIVFFGTPHLGADPRGILEHVVEMLAKALGFSVNEQIVNTLLPSGDLLKELRGEFNPIALQKRWIIHSFQEQYGVAALGGRKVVEDTSSCLDYRHETPEHIASNHMEMCRFCGLDDPEYKKVAAALSRIIANNVSNGPLAEPVARPAPALNENQRKMLLESLKFDQIDARHMTIKKAHNKTCKWLLVDPRYRAWVDARQFVNHHGFFWIKGNPGTGKSTLIKYAFNHAKRSMKDRIIAGFFFNARGDNLEKSTEGMYRSLLLQLFHKAPELQNAFDSLDLIGWKSDVVREWSLEALKELFEHAIRNLGTRRLTCFIDALDECDEEQIRDMISFCELLGEAAIDDSVQFDVCFSSRHYPHITINKGLSLILEGQKGHCLDIENYLNTELRIGNSKSANEIRDELRNKASGIFLWVFLVVQILNKEYARGKVRDLQKKLRDIPAGLHELFRDILSRGGQENNDGVLLSIQWVLFAKRPLTLKELYFAVLSGTEPGSPKEWHSEEITWEDMGRSILDSSKGLVEVTKSEYQTVQFIHESVRDFLLKENGLREIWPDIGTKFENLSHERLRQCCTKCMGIDISVAIPHIQLPKASSSEAANLRRSATDKFPFLEYAAQNVLYHAEMANGNCETDNDFIKNFPLLRWIDLHNLFERHEVRRYTRNASLPYILAEKNTPNLLREFCKIYPDEDPILGTTRERHGPPILAALATRSRDAVFAILKLEVDRKPQNLALRELYNRYCQDYINIRLIYGRSLAFNKSVDVLRNVIWRGDETLSAFLLETGRFDVNSKNREGHTLLCCAAQGLYDSVVQVLLDKGADPFLGVDCPQTLLNYAAFRGHEDIAQLLLSNKVGLNVNNISSRTVPDLAIRGTHSNIVVLLVSMEKFDLKSKNSNDETALHYAVRSGRSNIVELLLSTNGITLNAKNWFGDTALHYAVRSGHSNIVELLLSTERIDLNAKNEFGSTALHLAALYNHEDVAELLLSTKKVDVNEKDSRRRTALHLAAGYGGSGVPRLSFPLDTFDSMSRNKNIVELLLSRGNGDPELEDNVGDTPVTLATKAGRLYIVELLLRYKTRRGP